MSTYSNDQLFQLSLKNAIDREKLLLKKYEAYLTNNDDQELSDLLKEFECLSRSHIEQIQGKLKKLEL